MVVEVFVHNFYKTLSFLTLIFIYFYFLMFCEERDIKVSKNTYLAQFLTEVGNGTQTEIILGE